MEDELGGGRSHITSMLITLASTEWPQLTEKEARELNPAAPGMKRKQIWLNRENGEIINQNRENTEIRSIWCVCFHSISNYSCMAFA